MDKKQHQPEMQYHVAVARQDEAYATARARQHTLTLNIKKGDGAAGFNAAETLLAASGACILTNVNSIAAKMRLQIDEARIEFDAARRDDPPALTRISYRLVVRSPEPEEKLRQPHRLSVKWGTVTNTVINGLEPAGTLVIERM